MKFWPALAATGLVCASLGYLAGRTGVPYTLQAHQAAAVTPLRPSGIKVAPAPAPRSAPAVPVAQSGVRALNLLRVAVDTHGKTAQACLVFSAGLATGPDIHEADFLRIKPAIQMAVQATGERLCLAGLEFGTAYELTVLAGLQGADGSRHLADETLPLSLGDLPQSLKFADDGFILPRDLPGGLPVATVNVPRVHVRVERITDRVLVRTGLGQNYDDNSGGYDPETQASSDTLGVPVWDGNLAIKTARNERVLTGFPLAHVLGPRLPGAYRITLTRTKPTSANDTDTEDDGPQYRWVFETDLMLTTHRGTDGLHAFVRSLATARPVPGTVVTLLGANNDELGEATSNADGEAVFAAGLLRGVQGHVPRMVMAYHADDFTALQLDKPGFDFSDRGVDGRSDPGPVDGFLYTDRGIYRPGESIDLTTIVRGPLAEPLPAGQAVSIVLRRPDGVEAGRYRLEPNAVGAAAQVIPLKTTAPRGTWHLEELLAGTKTQIGTLDVQVQDFVPNRLAVDLSPDRTSVAAGAPATIAVNARYLYGAPAADLEVDAHVQLQADTSPIAEPGWQFGRAGEQLNTDSQDLDGPKTDAQGRSSVVVDLDKLKVPQTSLPLRADVTVSVAEPGGRATERQTSLKLATHPVLLGLRPPFADGHLDEGEAAAVAAAAFAPDGTRVAAHADFRLVEEVTDYHYFSENGAWQWKVSTHDRPVTFGAIDIPAAEGGTKIGLPALGWGTYRLEIEDHASGAATSIKLHGGFGEEQQADSPEKVAVSLIGPPPRAGGQAHLHVQAPFAGQMLLTVENSRVLAVHSVSVPASGADITVDATADWGVGAYVMASVYRPAGEASGHAPVRAVGLAYVKLDEADHTIGVALQAAPVLRPRTHLDLGVAVTGQAAQGPVWLTVAAVDEGILQLTRFASPDPEAHFFGKRRLAVDVRDDYAHLIDPTATQGELRAGGDLDGAGLSVVPTRTTALFSGLVHVEGGHAVIPIDLPDFTGGLRLMAVAVSPAGFGHADLQVPVRDPVVAQISLPRFLAPGDSARMTLLAHNVEGQAGTYHVHIEADGALAMQPVDEDLPLAVRQAVVKTYKLSGRTLGIGRVVLTLSGPDGLHIVHDWQMQVRTGFESVTLVSRADQVPGETVQLTRAMARGLSPDGATIRASFSSVGSIDLPGLLASLDEYPFGCSEQLVSRAMPLLYVQEAAAATLGASPVDLRLRVQDAIDKLMERQDESGAFGLWRAGDGEAEPYLGGEILDFLTRARAHGYPVPDAALSRAAKALTNFDSGNWMVHRFWFFAPNSPQQADRDQQIVDAGRAYAFLLQARAGQADLADLRYFHDQTLDKLEPLGQAQLATALAITGDQARAAHAFDAAEQGLATEQDGLAWRLADFYRTRLRDTAAMIALAEEANLRPRVDRLLQSLERMDMRPDRLTTQEQGWLVIAAGTLLERAGPATISIDGTVQMPQAVAVVRRDAAALGQGVAIGNAGRGPLTRTIAVHGLPLRAPPAGNAHLSISKTITDGDGNTVDLSHLVQNSRLVVHLSGSADDDAYHQTMLVDPLPAGFEIERVVEPSTKAAENGLPFLGDITPTRIAEKRDDRFMAAIDLSRVSDHLENDDNDSNNSDDDKQKTSNRAFNVAYVVRVVSPGRFLLPAASIRDMYRPDVQARGAVGSVTIQEN